MKVLIYIALHKRHELAKMYYPALLRFIDYAAKLGIEAFPIFIWSYQDDRAICERYFFHAPYVYADNKPLGAKLNAGLKTAFSMDWDYLMGFGADDIIRPEYWDAALPHMEQNKMCIGMTRLLCYELSTDKMKLVGPSSYCYGAGRMIARKYIEAGAYRYTVKCKFSNTAGDRRGQIKTIPKYKFKEFSYNYIDTAVELWPSQQNNAMDAGSQARIWEGMGVSGMWMQTVIDQDELYCLDLKTDHNVNKFDKLPGVVLKDHRKDELLKLFNV